MDITIKISENISRYEAYRLIWMLQHGHTLTELAQELQEVQYADPEDSEAISTPITELFRDWEQDVGFGGSLWACEGEFNDTPADQAIFEKPADTADK